MRVFKYSTKSFDNYKMQVMKKTWNYDTPYIDEEMAQGLQTYSSSYKNYSYLYYLLDPLLDFLTTLFTTKAFLSPNKVLNSSYHRLWLLLSYYSLYSMFILHSMLGAFLVIFLGYLLYSCFLCM